MAVPLFVGNVIALIWDFDQTLIPGYQQTPLFEEYGIRPKATEDDPTAGFWDEVQALEARYKVEDIEVSKGILYLNHLLTYAEAGRLPGLSNSKLRELGAKLRFYEGIPDFLDLARKHIEDDDRYSSHGITVEHYVVSTGLRQVILGSAIASHVKGVWGCEFIESPPGPGYLVETEKAPPPSGHIRQIGYFLDDTTKTRAIWEINKGTNVDPSIDVNAFISPEDRRVPLRNMLCIADGPSDVPMFSILNTFGGATLGVYNPNSEHHFEAVKNLADQGRVNAIAPADYREGTQATMWILSTLRRIADLIVRDRDVLLRERVQPPSGHVT